MDLSVIDWLDRTAEMFADKTVFSGEDGSMTFAEYDRMTKSVGTFLMKKGIRRSAAAIMTGRHIYTPPCYLGVARTGSYYIPMDASMPVSRLNQILQISEAAYMIVDREHKEIADTLDFSGEMFILEDILETEIDEALIAEGKAGIVEQDPLYMIFTSGSTGVPKGVITSHHSLMCYIEAFCEAVGMETEDVLGNQSPLDYIAAVRDIYIPTKIGASMVIIPKSQFAMPTQLFETLNRNHVTAICWSVAGVELPAKLKAFEAVKPETLKKVVFSGSVIANKYLQIWQDNLPDVKFVNQYGPTEATASCTYYIIPKRVEDGESIPIGVPYKNYRILLLNEDGTETKPGEIGEICVTGPILALGYYRNPEKTAESFIQNPLNDKFRELIYKTGDLGHMREDGLLAFNGRKDRQIKHMGHRIELGEIEEVARQMESVAECCALYDKDKEKLYLFYTGDAESKAIAMHFRSKLPAFMLPRKIMQLEEMPCLPNKKIDMQALRNLFK